MRAARYIARRRVRLYYDAEAEMDGAPPSTANTVPVVDRDDFTGLYNAQGEPLYRNKEPFGFRVRD